MAIHDAYQCSNCGEFELYENRQPEECVKCHEQFCFRCINNDGLCLECEAENEDEEE